jgi:tRNA A37 threonylcarbamoyltransferase TsaD
MWTLQPILFDDFLHWVANIARWLATSIVAENIPAAHAVTHLAVTVLAVSNVLPKDLHLRAVGGHSTLPLFRSALGGMA